MHTNSRARSMPIARGIEWKPPSAIYSPERPGARPTEASNPAMPDRAKARRSSAVWPDGALSMRIGLLELEVALRRRGRRSAGRRGVLLPMRSDVHDQLVDVGAARRSRSLRVDGRSEIAKQCVLPTLRLGLIQLRLTFLRSFLGLLGGLRSLFLDLVEERHGEILSRAG